MADVEKNAYIIVKSRLLETIETKVNDKVREGYVPLGTLILSTGEADYLQVMILKDLVK